MRSSDKPQDNTVDFSKEENKIGAQYLIAELDLMRQLRDSTITVSDRRVDVLLTLATALGAGLVLLTQAHPAGNSFLLVSLLSIASLLSIGISTLRLVIERDILMVEYTRASNRIRAFFGSNVEAIRDYLLMPTSYAYPRYNWFLSNRSTVMLINSLSFGALGSVFSLLVRQGSSIDFSVVYPIVKTAG